MFIDQLLAKLEYVYWAGYKHKETEILKERDLLPEERGWDETKFMEVLKKMLEIYDNALPKLK